MHADDVGPVFDHRVALLHENSPQLTVTKAAPKLRAAHTFIWFYTGTSDRMTVQNRAFADALTRLKLRHRFFIVRGGHNWAIWRGNAARAYLAASRALRAA
jgi:enterochelin esterase-like enzyme